MSGRDQIFDQWREHLLGAPEREVTNAQVIGKLKSTNEAAHKRLESLLEPHDSGPGPVRVVAWRGRKRDLSFDHGWMWRQTPTSFSKTLLSKIQEAQYASLHREPPPR